jgi:hypothetical protein
MNDVDGFNLDAMLADQPQRIMMGVTTQKPSIMTQLNTSNLAKPIFHGGRKDVDGVRYWHWSQPKYSRTHSIWLRNGVLKSNVGGALKIPPKEKTSLSTVITMKRWESKCR